MPDQTVQRLIYGTDEPPAPERLIEVGDLALLYAADAIRVISWQGVEIVRAIAWPIRDPNWVTLPARVISEAVEQRTSEAQIRLAFDVGDGALTCDLAITATAGGEVSAELAMTANTEFRTNRAGFTVLHPLNGVAGEPLAIRHSDGNVEQAAFPRAISPGQPAFDIVGLSHTVAGVDVDITFAGEIFEMEDQRNWSDASYKTYCRPLVVPFTYSIAKDETQRQSIVIRMSGEPAAAEGADGPGPLEFSTTDEPFPQIGLAVEAGWLNGDCADTVALTDVSLLQVRVATDMDAATLADMAGFAGRIGAEVDAEIVIPDGEDPAPALASLAERFDTAGLEPVRVTALPQSYLASHQPSGPWPDGPTPADAAAAARSVFAGCQVGAGMLTNFTEFNRCRPGPDDGDFITHGSAAIVHAADDRSVIETIEALPQIFASAWDLGGRKPYRLGLVSIGMRSNPYGAAVADNPGMVRQAMAMHDPRQHGLFAAAWAVAALASTAGCDLEALSLAAPAGPFGIIADGGQGRVHPLFHVVRAAAGLSGKARIGISGLPAGTHGFAAVDAGTTKIVIANLGPDNAMLQLPDGYGAKILDTSSFAEAGPDPLWLDGAGSGDPAAELPPFSILFGSRGAS